MNIKKVTFLYLYTTRNEFDITSFPIPTHSFSRKIVEIFYVKIRMSKMSMVIFSFQKVRVSNRKSSNISKTNTWFSRI